MVGLLVGFISWLKNWLGCAPLLEKGYGWNRDKSSDVVPSSPGIWSYHETMSCFMQIYAIKLNNCCKSVRRRFALHLINIHTTGSSSHHMLTHFLQTHLYNTLIAKQLPPALANVPLYLRFRNVRAIYLEKKVNFLHL